MSNGTVLVTGASSQLGVYLLPRLQKQGCRIRALSRSAPPQPLEVAQDITWARSEHHLPEDIRHLVSCGPPELARRLAGNLEELESLVVFTTSSVLSKADSANPDEHTLIAAIAKEERALRDLCRERSIPLVLIRPTLIYGCGLDRNISLLYRIGQKTGYIPLSSRANGMRQPVHADDLAALAVRALDYREPGCLEGQAGGGSTLSYRDMVKAIAQCGPRKARLLPLHPAVLSAAVRLLAQTGHWGGLNSEMVHRQAVDLVFDDTVFREALGFDPRPFEPSVKDFSIPHQPGKLRLPG